MKPQFPTVQEQINYWNEIERLEHERVMNIRAESPNERTQTGEVELLAALEETRDLLIAYKVAFPNHFSDLDARFGADAVIKRGYAVIQKVVQQ